MPLYLASANTYDRAAIMHAAWAMARREVVAIGRCVGPFKGRVTTAHSEFPRCLRKVWADARGERSYAAWCIEQDADKAREAALPLRDQQIESARYALMLAEHNDTMSGHRLVSEARARLDQLQRAA
jgi:hypothetical protein